jgi:hypothetical protein
LNDDDPLAVKVMIHYLYHLDYPHQDDLTQSSNPDEADITAPKSIFGNKPDGKAKTAGGLDHNATERSNFILHAKLYALAEKYCIEGLKHTALEKFKVDATVCWKSTDFLLAARVVYTSTPDQDRPMRDLVVETFGKHPSLLDDEVAQNVVRNLDLCYDLMMLFRTTSPLAVP